MDTNEKLVDLATRHGIHEFNNYRAKIDAAIEEINHRPIFIEEMKGLRIITDNNIRSLFKNYMLRRIKRYTTRQIIDMGYVIYNSDLDLNDAIWSNIATCSKASYFIVCNPTTGKIYKGVIRPNSLAKLSNLKKYGNTQPDYSNVEIPYSKFIYQNQTFCNAGTTEHQIMAACTGLMDDKSFFELATYTTNHKNRGHYDNRKVNLEFVSVQSNNVHKIVTSKLREVGSYYSMSAQACFDYDKLTEKQKFLYKENMHELLSKGERYDLVNDIILYKYLEGKNED